MHPMVSVAMFFWSFTFPGLQPAALPKESNGINLPWRSIRSIRPKSHRSPLHDSWVTAIPIELGFGCCHDLKHQVIEDDRRVLVLWSLLSLWQETADDSYAARKLQRFWDGRQLRKLIFSASFHTLMSMCFVKKRNTEIPLVTSFSNVDGLQSQWSPHTDGGNSSQPSSPEFFSRCHRTFLGAGRR